MNIAGKHVAVLVHNYFEQAEFEEPISALKDAGAEVTIIAVNKKTLQGLNHTDKGDAFEADLLLEQASSGDYDALVLPGGAINADQLRVIGAAQDWVKDFLDAGKPVAAICHAPWLLVSADEVAGRRLTSYHTLEDDIVNAGGDWVNEPLIIDGNLITSRKPDDLPQFNDAIIEMLGRQQSSAIPDAADTPIGDSEQENEDSTRLRSLGYDKEHDEITDDDEAEMLADADDEDPDELHLSDVTPGGEQSAG